MRTAVAETSIRTYHDRVVPEFESSQAGIILEFIARCGESTIGEIAKALRMEKSTVSARQNKLRKDGLLVFGAVRRCRVSGVSCTPLKLPAAQPALFK